MEKTSVIYRQRFKRRARRVARRVLPFMASLFMATPLASPVINSKVRAASTETKLPSVKELQATFYNQRTHNLYQELGLENQGLRFEVFEKALTG